MRKIQVFIVFSGLLVGSGVSTHVSAQDPDPDRYIVTASQGRSVAAQAVQAAGGEIARTIHGYPGVAAQLSSRALEALSRNPNLVIEKDNPRYPMSQTQPYGIGMVQAGASGISGGADTRTVCVIDSGYDLGHEDLPSVGVSGYDGNLPWDQDGSNHGTHVAGTILAQDNSVGVVGVHPGSDLFIVRVFGDSGSWAYASDLIDAAYRCRDGGADVISMSLGCSGRFCASSSEEAAFDDLYGNFGILNVAAAGNDGNTQHSYPASYDSVISVGAVDAAEVVADFSQQNNQVELAAPGVSIRSTVSMGQGSEESAIVDGVGYEVTGMDGSPDTTGSGPLVDCGLGTSACPGGGGQVCLIQRGDITFADKVLACEGGGGVAAIIYNNVDGLFSGTLGGTATSIPSVGMSKADGEALDGSGASSATVTTGVGNYSFFDGTSMATPHVSGVAALVWSHNAGWTNQQVRDALAATAKDLGAAGRDNAYGWGLVQARDALCALDPAKVECGGTGNLPPTADFTFTTSGLTADFTDTSSDGDGTVVSWSWDFGDGNGSTAQHPSHTYLADGTYTVSLTVTDDEGAADTISQDVTVGEPPSGGITLGAVGTKVKGAHTVDLSWSGATTTNVDIHVVSFTKAGSELRTITTANDGFYTDSTSTKGWGEYQYQVCESGSSTCSEVVTVIF